MIIQQIENLIEYIDKLPTPHTNNRDLGNYEEIRKRLKDILFSEKEGKIYGMCVVCNKVPVDIDAGYDTCQYCITKI